MALKADPTTVQVKEKADKIAEIRGKFESADAAVLTEYRGLSVTALAELRNQLRPVGAEYKVYKNTLVLRAAAEIGVEGELEAMLAGPVAIAFVSGDAAAAAKALREFAKTNENLVVKGGLLGDRPLTTSDVDALAELPPRNVLLSQIAGLFEAPLSQTASLLEALLRDTVGLVSALVDKRIAGGEEAPAAQAPAAEAPSDEPVAEAASEEAPVAEAAAADEAPADEPAAAEAPASEEPPAAEEPAAEGDQ